MDSRYPSLAFSHAPAGMAIVDMAARAVAVNPALCRLTGRSAEQLCAAPLPLVGLGVPTDALQALFVGRAATCHVETTWQRAGGEPVWVAVTGVLVSGGDTRVALLYVQDITAQHAREAELAALAERDPLTQLYNRRYFTQAVRMELWQAGRYGPRGALLLIDLDHFKPVNDRCGHQAGDGILCAVAGELQQHVRTTDVVARLGGDEFGILLRHVSAQEATEVARAIVSGLRAQDQRHDSVLRGCTRASVGVTLLQGSSSESVIAAADAAMYAAKRDGGDRWALSPAS